MVTDRDIDIFKTLVNGPCTLKQIHYELNSMGRRDQKSDDDRGDAYGRKSTKTAVEKRLSRLRKGGYIVSRSYLDTKNGGVVALHVLGQPALQELVVGHGFKVNHIRNMLPSPERAAHDLMVTSLVKAVRAEAARSGFEVDYEDENWLKSTLGGPRKGMSYPDLYVKLTFKVSGGLKRVAHIGLEIDNLTMSHRRMFQKAKYIFQERQWHNMILSNKRIRCDNLRQSFYSYVEREIHTSAKIGRMGKGNPESLYRCAYFATIGSFISKGFLSTRWLTIGGTEMEVIPAEASVRRDASEKERP
jgi:hypothetical protein